MIYRVITCILMVCIGCKTVSKTVATPDISEGNKDVVALSYVIRDYMQKTGNTNFTLRDIDNNDTVGRITQNFSMLAVANWPNIWRGGYTVYFKFSSERNKNSVNLMPYETMFWKIKTKKTIGRNTAQVAAKFDGEIHFYYPERHYQIAEIILKKAQ